MAEKLDPRELVSFKELLMSEVIQSGVLVEIGQCNFCQFSEAAHVDTSFLIVKPMNIAAQ
jgi:hypothetical protein